MKFDMQSGLVKGKKGFKVKHDQDQWKEFLQ